MTTTETSPAIDHAHGHELLQRFIRGDALIGIMENARDAQFEMTAALRRAANAGHAEAFYDLGQCNAAVGIMILQEEIEGTTGAASSWLDAAEAHGFDVESLLDACELDDPRAAPDA